MLRNPRTGMQVTESDRSGLSSSATSPAKTMSFICLNLPCFPSGICKSSYTKILSHTNLERVRQFIGQIKAAPAGSYDALCLMEIWDPVCADLLQRELKDYFPYQKRGATIHSVVNSVTSGLLFLSRRKIIGFKHVVFDNPSASEEMIGKKGYFAVKLADDTLDDVYDSLIFTHLHGDDSWVPKGSDWWGGNPEFRRGQQMKAIHQGTRKWAITAPATYRWYKHRHTILMGDMNTRLDCHTQNGILDDRNWLGIKPDGRLSSLGQFQLLSEYDPVSPDNFLKVQSRSPGWEVDEELHAEAKKQNKFVGSWSDGSDCSKPTNLLIDMAALGKNGSRMGRLKTSLVTFNSPEMKVSDHEAIQADVDLSQPRDKKETLIADRRIRELPAVHPLAGFWYRFWGIAEKCYELLDKRPLLASEEKSHIDQGSSSSARSVTERSSLSL